MCNICSITTKTGNGLMMRKRWRRKFKDPIELPVGRTLVTLHDAAQYILALPRRTVEQEKWQLAMRCLIDAADRDGIRMVARIAMMRALSE